MMNDGFVGRYEVVEPRRGNRRWPDGVKARIVAESLEPGDPLPLPKLACEVPQAGSSVLTLEIGSDVVMRIPGDVPVDRVAALVRAMRGTA